MIDVSASFLKFTISCGSVVPGAPASKADSFAVASPSGEPLVCLCYVIACRVCPFDSLHVFAVGGYGNPAASGGYNTAAAGTKTYAEL